MEQEFTLFLIRYLADTRFRNKRIFAEALNVPYRALLNECAGKGNMGSAMQMTQKILRYCIKHKISLEAVFTEFH